LTVREEDAPKTSGLRGLLKTKMPDYMVPSAFVILDRFPLSPNGKVDRKTLPKPDFEPAAAPSEPPKTPTEIALAGIWSEVLGVKQIGRCDNFFDLGGHSLLAIRIISRIRSVFQIELALPSLFQNPTLKGVAAAVDQQTLDDVQPDELSRMVLEIEGADGEPAV
jgi:acyl carrier protein